MLLTLSNNKELFLKILISSIPVILAGFILVQSNLIEKIRSIEIIGWTTFVFGILLYISDRYKLKKTISIDFSYKSAIFIGFFQVLSLIPGVSRSGVSITAARFLKFNNLAAVIVIPDLLTPGIKDKT